MAVVFACAASHAPGITAWTEAAPKEQADKIIGSYHKLQAMLDATKPDALLAISVEHWANFFLNQMPTFCIGRADHYDGPVEEWLRISKSRIPGDSQLSAELLDGCLEAGFDLSFSDELLFDHATMLPIHFLTPRMDIPVVPLILNTLTHPCHHRSAATHWVVCWERRLRNILNELLSSPLAACPIGQEKPSMERSTSPSTNDSWTF